MKSKRLAREFIDNLRSSLRKMTSPDNTAESAKPPQIDNSRTSPSSYAGLKHASSFGLQKTQARICDVFPLAISVNDKAYGGTVSGFLHLPQHYRTTPIQNRVNTAAILLSGAGGGVVGPLSIYLSMGDKLASLRQGIPVLRLDYRFPARNRPCCQYVISAMRFLETDCQISSFVLVGWSFGSAPVFTVAASESAVVGCATVAGQTAETGGIRVLHPRPVLFLHGTGDRILSQRCSESLYQDYGTQGERRIHFFEGDDHALTRFSLQAEEMLCAFVAKCAGVDVGLREREEVVGLRLVGEGEKVELMEKGGDLRGFEVVN